MRIYISGKISGREAEARKEFAKVSRQLEEIGHDPVNPFENGLEVDDTWERHLAVDITDLLGCDAVCQLDGWEDSRGARLEYEVARVNDIPAWGLDVFLSGVSFGAASEDGTGPRKRRPFRLLGTPLGAVRSGNWKFAEKTVKALAKQGCSTLGDLVTFSEDELKEITGLTFNARQEIKYLLKELGFDRIPVDIRHYGFHPSEGLANDYARLQSL